MIKVYAYKLKFKTPLHIGEREEFLESTEKYIPSDTLFSAFCNAYLLLYGGTNLKNLLNKFQNAENPFLISSCFLWHKDRFFFPVPLNQFPKDKKYKNIKFVPKDIFEELLAGKRIESEEFKDILAEKSDVKIKTVPRVKINRFGKETEYFHFSQIVFEDEAGFYFLVNFKDVSFKEKFEATLNLLGDEGMGGDRSSGKGLFEIVEKNVIEFKEIPDANGFITLSLTYPKENEIEYLKDGFYEIIPREGYIFSPFAKTLRKKSLKMLKEGTVTRGKIEGSIVNVTPENFKQHSIYKYGISFSLPIRIERKNEN